jgi:hypothetical protein
MSGIPHPPATPSVRDRLRQRLRPRSRASSPTPAPISSQALTSSVVQPPSPPSTQILASSSRLLTGLATAHLPDAGASSLAYTSHSSSGNNVLEGALKRLSPSDRTILWEYIILASHDVDFALRQALAAAKQKQQYCIEKRWAFTFAGRKITLKEEADKVIHWLHRFRAVGDVAVNADPMLAGLPWAGIRLVLEVRLI